MVTRIFEQSILGCEIFLYLDVAEYINLFGVSRLFLKYASLNILWEMTYKKYLNAYCNSDRIRKHLDMHTWKNIFQTTYQLVKFYNTRNNGLHNKSKYAENYNKWISRIYLNRFLLTT